MNIVLTQQEQTAAIREFSEIIGFYIAFEEGATVKDRAETFAKNYPMFTEIRKRLLCTEKEEKPKTDRNRKADHVTTE